MTRRWASYLIFVCTFLALTSTRAKSAPRAGDPCKQLRSTLDQQVDDLKIQQHDDLKQCEQSNGRGSAQCLGLRDQQKQALRTIRNSRTDQMTRCYGGPSRGRSLAPGVEETNQTYFNQADNQY